MAKQKIRKRPMSEINVVPYIDVMLVLLVIFMITAPLLTQGVKVELPKASAKPMSSQKLKPLILTVDIQGQFYLDVGGEPNQPLDASTLVARMAAVLQSKKGTQVLVRGDEGVSYGKVMDAMVLAQRAGAPSVGLITRNPEP
jgi:biopolymer transport protein TolR